MTNTGIWEKHEVEGQHVFSYNLARWIGDFLPNSPIVDMGCGLGTYLDYLHRIGFNDLLGVEGADLEELSEFDPVIVKDLATPLTLEVKRNVISLEVAEHIPGEYQDVYIDNLTRNADKYIIMSWGIPGQAGFGHVNCRHNIEVIEDMSKRGFKFLYEETMAARDCIEHYCSWFKNTILIFERC